ncbi:MAG: hypothetical protein ABEL51_03710 [Salinibacter sp.]
MRVERRRLSGAEWERMRKRERRQRERAPRKHVYGGLDISSGKRHPSHLAVLKGHETEGGLVFYQTVSKWFDQTPLIEVLDEAKQICADEGVEALYFDNTRDELTVSMDQHEVPRNWNPVHFTAQLKWKMAHQLDRALHLGELKLLPDERQQRQLILVDQLLKAEETDEGHADVFWSLALALDAASEFSRPFEERFQLFT